MRTTTTTRRSSSTRRRANVPKEAQTSPVANRQDKTSRLSVSGIKRVPRNGRQPTSDGAERILYQLSSSLGEDEQEETTSLYNFGLQRPCHWQWPRRLLKLLIARRRCMLPRSDFQCQRPYICSFSLLCTCFPFGPRRLTGRTRTCPLSNGRQGPVGLNVHIRQHQGRQSPTGGD